MWDRRLGARGRVPAAAAGPAVRAWRGAEQGQAAVRRVPGAHRVPRRGPRQPDRVGRLGRHDRARAPGPPPPPPNASWRAVLETRSRAARRRGRQRRRLTRHRLSRRQRRSTLPGEQLADPTQAVEVVHVAGQRRHDRGRHLRVRRREPVAQPRLPLDHAGPGRRAAAAAPRSASPGRRSRSRSAAAIASSADSVALRAAGWPG